MLLEVGVDDPAEQVTMTGIMERATGMNAKYMLQVIEGWNLDEPLTEESAQQLADEVPAAANAIMEQYREAVTQGRLGN